MLQLERVQHTLQGPRAWYPSICTDVVSLVRARGSGHPPLGFDLRPGTGKTGSSPPLIVASCRGDIAPRSSSWSCLSSRSHCIAFQRNPTPGCREVEPPASNGGGRPARARARAAGHSIPPPSPKGAELPPGHGQPLTVAQIGRHQQLTTVHRPVQKPLGHMGVRRSSERRLERARRARSAVIVLRERGLERGGREATGCCAVAFHLPVSRKPRIGRTGCVQ